MQSLKGKVAVITGASSGIGAGIAQCFARQGALLSLAGRKKENLKDVASKTDLPESKILSTTGDVVKEEDRNQLIEKTVDKFGKIDILVNNAGVGGFGLMEEITEQYYDSIMDVNLKAPLLLTRLAIPHLVKSEGNIINISSTVSSALPPGSSAYCLSKVALDAYTKLLAAELGPRRVRVNALNPGIVRTKIFAKSNMPKEIVDMLETSSSLGRPATVEEIAQVAAFLASDLASFVTGEILYADGGFRLNKA